MKNKQKILSKSLSSFRLPSQLALRLSMAPFALLLCLVSLGLVLAEESPSTTVKPSAPDSVQVKKQEVIDYKKIPDSEWKKRLTKIQFSVTRRHDTERAFTGKYHDYKKDGVYTCVCCGQPLFDSGTKFDSGTGWPSFYQPVKEDMIGKTKDTKLAYPRIEVHCSRCDAHLGHVFNDAPQTPTGLRYCMNSASLNFLDREEGDKLLKQESEKSTNDNSEDIQDKTQE